MDLKGVFMKKKIVTYVIMFATLLSMNFYECVNAEQTDAMIVQNIGMKLLICNNIPERFTFSLSGISENSQMPILNDSSYFNDLDLHNNRNVFIPYNDYVKLTSNDEVAAILAHNIAQGLHSYTGILNGQLMFTKNGAFPFNAITKSNELNFDKQAVDLLAKAGYNPVSIITAYSKTLSEVRGTFWGRHNKANKRMINVYRYIKRQYPEYLGVNDYTKSVYYTRFLKTNSL
jgi:hypothetical protein